MFCPFSWQGGYSNNFHKVSYTMSLLKSQAHRLHRPSSVVTSNSSYLYLIGRVMRPLKFARSANLGKMFGLGWEGVTGKSGNRVMRIIAHNLRRRGRLRAVAYRYDRLKFF